MDLYELVEKNDLENFKVYLEECKELINYTLTDENPLCIFIRKDKPDFMLTFLNSKYVSRDTKDRLCMNILEDPLMEDNNMILDYWSDKNEV